MMNFVKEGDYVYFRERWTDSCHKGVILKFVEDSAGTYAVTRDLTAEGEICARLGDLYATPEECQKAIEKETRDIQEKYLSGLGSVEDLVRFMYTHTVCNAEEYTDWNARKVVRQKAKELLDIDLGI